MPSIVIHVAVANKVAKNLNMFNKDYMVGAIAPDLSVLVGNERAYSHFCDDFYGAPNIDKFLYKYRKDLNKFFVLGYFVHLYTDYLFETYFVPSFFDEKKDIITKIDGTRFKCNHAGMKQYLYNDYTDLNIKLINKYKLDFSFLDEEYTSNSNDIDEIPMDKISLLYTKTKDIIEKSKEKKNLLFNIKDMISFIDFSSKLISQKINELLD